MHDATSTKNRTDGGPDPTRSGPVRKRKPARLDPPADGKEDFLALVSHELRTPLTIIKGYLDMFDAGQMGRLSEAQVRGTRLMLEHCGQLERLIGNLIQLRDLSLYPDRSTPETVFLQPVFRRLESAERDRVRRAGMELSVRLAPPDLACRCDPAYLCALLENLVDNAVKHARGSERVRLAASACDRARPGGTCIVPAPAENEAGWVCLRVRDHGPGIPVDRLESLCEAFRQGQRYLTRTVSGLGIGLATVKKIVELSGGAMGIHSEVGRGTEVSVYLPAPDHTGGTGCKRNTYDQEDPDY